jgi:DNA-binding LacI/PurR family transcriptional regulator
MESLPGAAARSAGSPARIADVAALAGVGVATVSRVINGQMGVRPSTRERVIEAIEALNYRPSSLARGLSLQRTMVVAAVLPWFTNPSAVQRVRGIVDGLSASNYDLMLFDIESEGRQRRAFELFDRGDRADGLLVVSTLPPEAEVDRLRAADIPCVLIDAVHPSFPSIAVDDVAGGEMATRHLVELGHRRVALIGDPPPEFRFELGGTSARSPPRGSKREPTTCAREHAYRTSPGPSPPSSSPCPSGPPQSSPPRTHRQSACSRPPGRSGSASRESCP